MSDTTSSHARVEPVKEFLLGLQDRICEALEAQEPKERFGRIELPGERGGLARPRVLEEGEVIEKAAVQFSHSMGDSLPKAATDRRLELMGRRFEAVSVSLIVHPRNPYAPTAHANVRFFIAEMPGEPPVWWFGGGFDLTPYYGFDEDCAHWHRTAKAACDSVHTDLYPRLKQECDTYFFLPHRKEPRGIGGVFYDDLNEGAFEGASFDSCFALHQAVGEGFIEAYLPLLERRKATAFGEREREFQLYRRGRYVEFNLAWDRGTKFGLQSGGRIESILASLPNLVKWRYDWTPEPGTEEARLYERYLVPRDWAGMPA